jgi:uncharacterized Zn-finger protein
LIVRHRHGYHRRRRPVNRRRLLFLWISPAPEGRLAARRQGDSMQNFETVYVDDTHVACDGGGGVGGHPRVYLNLAPSGAVECPYCSRNFVLRAAADDRGAVAATRLP